MPWGVASLVASAARIGSVTSHAREDVVQPSWDPLVPALKASVVSDRIRSNVHGIPGGVVVAVDAVRATGEKAGLGRASNPMSPIPRRCQLGHFNMEAASTSCEVLIPHQAEEETNKENPMHDASGHGKSIHV